MPIGVGLQNSISQLGTNVLDKLLSRASARCDSFCRRRLQAPGSTILTQNVPVGSTQLPVASTLTLDNLDEQTVIMGDPANSEIIPIVAGGVTVSSWASPYPGIIQLANPTVGDYEIGDAVQFGYQEISDISESGDTAQGGLYTGVAQSGTVKLAMTYLPPIGDLLSRTVFLKTYPILNLALIEYSYFSETFTGVDFTEGLSIAVNEGWYQFRVGQIILKDGLMRTTYQAGYQTIPDDVKIATSYYFAEQMMQIVNPYSYIQLSMGKRMQRWGTPMRPKLGVVEQAEDVLQRYVRYI